MWERGEATPRPPLLHREASTELLTRLADDASEKAAAELLPKVSELLGAIRGCNWSGAAVCDSVNLRVFGIVEFWQPMALRNATPHRR